MGSRHTTAAARDIEDACPHIDLDYKPSHRHSRTLVATDTEWFPSSSEWDDNFWSADTHSTFDIFGERPLSILGMFPVKKVVFVLDNEYLHSHEGHRSKRFVDISRSSRLEDVAQLVGV